MTHLKSSREHWCERETIWYYTLKQRRIEKKEGERETIETYLEVFRQQLSREDTNSTDRESETHINTQVLNKRERERERERERCMYKYIRENILTWTET